MPCTVSAWDAMKYEKSTRIDKIQRVETRTTSRTRIDITGTGNTCHGKYSGRTPYGLSPRRRRGCGLCALISALQEAGHHTPETGWQGKLYGFYGKRYPKSAKSTGVFWKHPTQKVIYWQNSMKEDTVSIWVQRELLLQGSISNIDSEITETAAEVEKISVALVKIQYIDKNFQNTTTNCTKLKACVN